MPEIIDAQEGSTSGTASLSVKTEYAGVSSGDNSFKFIVYYNKQETNSEEQVMEFPFSQYSNGMVETITVESLSAGNYTSSVLASNQYGNSRRSIPKQFIIGQYQFFIIHFLVFVQSRSLPQVVQVHLLVLYLVV